MSLTKGVFSNRSGFASSAATKTRAWLGLLLDCGGPTPIVLPEQGKAYEPTSSNIIPQANLANLTPGKALGTCV